VVRDNLGEGGQAVLLDGVLAGNDERGGTVGDARGGTGGDNTVLLEGGLELFFFLIYFYFRLLENKRCFCPLPTYLLEALEGGGTETLVLSKVKGTLLGLDGDGGNLVLEHALLGGLGGELLAAEAKGIAVGLGDVVLGGEVLGGEAHGDVGVEVGQACPERVLKGNAGTEGGAKAGAADDVGRLAHALGATGERDVGDAELDLLHGRDHGLEARAAQAVERQGGDLDGEAGLEADVAGEVRGVGRGLLDVAKVDGADLVKGDLAGGEGGLGRVHTEVGGGEVLRRQQQLVFWQG